MLMYKVKGSYRGKEIRYCVFDSYHPHSVEVELWSPKPGFDRIPLGESHYDIVKLRFKDRRFYEHLLFREECDEMSKRYLRKLELEPVKRIL